jgi:RimJ/RimL family protein N-acetyltransferase
VAVSPDDELVGYTELVLVPDDRDAHQAETLVHPAHRGHRLGMALKRANLDTLRTDAPDRRRVHTHVAPDNAAMNAVNHALGFAPVEYCDEMAARIIHVSCQRAFALEGNVGLTTRQSLRSRIQRTE